ncbi:MAG TPA: hypothetical protein VE078_00655 [Thermoanaerobaculia bacterium]|nr:hypothetical protein [Thermoanaerobaculia bacterium]
MEVPAAGWVRVPLDLGALRHMAPGGSDLHVFAPDGERVALRLAASPPEAALTLSTRGARCGLLPSGALCLLEFPGGQILRNLTVDVEAEGAVGYRLYAPKEFLWQALAEGVWALDGNGGRHNIPGGARRIEGSTLRLELYGEEGKPPRLTGYGLDLDLPTVLFLAPGPGRYLLAYGGSGAATPANTAPAPPAGETAANVADTADTLWIDPGAEQESPLPPLPTLMGAPLEPNRFSARWAVAAPGAEPGDLVRLELPGAVYGAVREDLGDLRLAAGGRQVPFYRWSSPDPAFAGGEAELQPSAADRPGESQVALKLPAAGLPLTQVHLTAGLTGGRAPFHRPVTIELGDLDQPAARSNWRCLPRPPLPCRQLLALSGAAPQLLTVRLRDGDNSRLPALGVSAWRRRDVLLFVWPELEEGAAVRIFAGSEGLEPPRYDFAELGPSLLGRPWQAAELRSESAAPAPPWWSRGVMPAALILAGVWLVVLLRRILAEA